MKDMSRRAFEREFRHLYFEVNPNNIEERIGYVFCQSYSRSVVRRDEEGDFDIQEALDLVAAQKGIPREKLERLVREYDADRCDEGSAKALKSVGVVREYSAK